MKTAVGHPTGWQRWVRRPQAVRWRRAVFQVYLWSGINGIGIPCAGPGWCDQITKAMWAIFGLAPAAMFVTGTVMWWNRVVRPWRQASSSASRGR